MTHSQAKGFTLVELLVVIAIIASLAAMATPVIMKALTKAKIVTAKEICVSLENSLNRYYDDNNSLPFDGGNDAYDDTEVGTPIRSDGDLMAILAGVKKDEYDKKTAYFNTGEPTGSNEDSYKGGMKIEGQTAKLYDPWGETYYILLDYDFNEMIENPFDTGDGNEIHGKRALIFSTGPERQVPESGATNRVLKEIPSNFR